MNFKVLIIILCRSICLLYKYMPFFLGQPYIAPYLGKLYEKIVREGVYLENIIKKVGHKKIAAHLYLIYDNMIAKRLIEETLEFLENLLFYRRVRFEIV